MKKKSLTRNYIYNLLLNSVNLIFPLITAPYLSSILGAHNIGKVNYATSIVGWFTLFAAFGIPRYGMREISKNRDSKEKITETFYNMIIIQSILSIIAIGGYLFLIFNVQGFYNELYLYIIMLITIILNIFSIDWFYQGFEEYGFLALRNVIFKIITLILIFCFIKNESDYILFAFINIIGISINNILNFLNIKKYLCREKIQIKIFYYIKELKSYFYITLIIALYTQLDQTLVGNVSETELAFYLRSKVFLGIGFSVVNSFITVLIPRAAYLAKNNYDEYKKVINLGINYIYLLAFPCVVGLYFLSDELMILFGGQEFLPASQSLKIISLLLLVTSISIFQMEQVLLPNGKEKTVINIQVCAAIFSMTLNIILIPLFSFIGASVTWLFTELFMTLLEIIVIKIKLKKIKIVYINPALIKYMSASLVMGLCIVGIKVSNINVILVILLSLITSPIAYFSLLLLFKDELLLEIFNNIKLIINKQINFKKL